MALITKMHRCAFCGSSEVVVSENGTYTCKDCGKVADHGMPAADVEAINRIMMTGESGRFPPAAQTAGTPGP